MTSSSDNKKLQNFATRRLKELDLSKNQFNSLSDKQKVHVMDFWRFFSDHNDPVKLIDSLPQEKIKIWLPKLLKTNSNITKAYLNSNNKAKFLQDAKQIYIFLNSEVGKEKIILNLVQQCTKARVYKVGKCYKIITNLPIEKYIWDPNTGNAQEYSTQVHAKDTKYNYWHILDDSYYVSMKNYKINIKLSLMSYFEDEDINQITIDKPIVNKNSYLNNCLPNTLLHPIFKSSLKNITNLPTEVQNFLLLE